MFGQYLSEYFVEKDVSKSKIDHYFNTKVNLSGTGL